MIIFVSQVKDMLIFMHKAGNYGDRKHWQKFKIISFDDYLLYLDDRGLHFFITSFNSTCALWVLVLAQHVVFPLSLRHLEQ